MFVPLFSFSEQRAALQTHRQHSAVAQSHGVSGSPQGKGLAQTPVLQTHAPCLTNTYSIQTIESTFTVLTH